MERTAKIMAVLGLLVLCGSALAADGNEPIAHWKFDETSGTIAYDSAGDNNGTVYGAIWTAGQIDGALSFDGVNDYVDCGNTFESVTGSATKSIMAWVKSATTDYSTAGGLILELYRKSDSSSGFYVKAKGNPATWQSFHRTSGSYTILDSGVYVTNEWTHVALVQDGPKVDLYVNGVSEASASDGVAPSTSSPLNASIGAYIYRATAYACFNGSIDEVRIYDRALSAEEIREVYLDAFSRYERAIIQIEDALAEKEEMLEVIDKTLDKEVDAYNALEELLESGDYGDLKKGDIVTAKQKIHSAIQHEEQSMNTLEKSIEKLEDSLSVLGCEVEPNGGNN